ncbi:hypothetical protein HaLaN_01382 [Haematococcus lacustris]|uniref:Uncharacterized protein n=1 Tax=Haematococcus lacustris TaxID=44745 RepID=A0A699Y956_HAELA|nr:hypothetical protein HaLaN_01382 [Haematococcus lacustris]
MHASWGRTPAATAAHAWQVKEAPCQQRLNLGPPPAPAPAARRGQDESWPTAAGVMHVRGACPPGALDPPGYMCHVVVVMRCHATTKCPE